MDEWVREMRVHGNTEMTIEHWWYQIGYFALHSRKRPEKITDADILTWLGRGVSISAIRSDCNAASSFFKWAKLHGKRADNPMKSIPVVKRDKRKKQPASEEAVRKGLASTDWRVRLMVMLMDDAGLRRREISVIHTDDLIDDLLGKSLVVHGKGRKDRIAPLTTELVYEIEKRPQGWLFPGQYGGHMCADSVYRLVVRATGETPHAFRRKFATDVWHATGDAVKVKELLGHESLETTQNYIFSTAEDLREAVDAMNLYRRQQSVGIAHPDRLLEAYDVPKPIIDLVIRSITGLQGHEEIK
jgi:integrase/recombinase XerD